MNSKRFDPVFDVMIESGEVETCDVKKENGRSYPGFRLTPTHSDSLRLSDCPTDTSTQSDSLPCKGESESVCVSVPESVCGGKESESECIDERGIDEPF